MKPREQIAAALAALGEIIMAADEANMKALEDLRAMLIALDSMAAITAGEQFVCAGVEERMSGALAAVEVEVGHALGRRFRVRVEGEDLEECRLLANRYLQKWAP